MGLLLSTVISSPPKAPLCYQVCDRFFGIYMVAPTSRSWGEILSYK